MAVLTRGAVIGKRYEILEILGRGGMGVVYKGRDRILDEDVALKVLRRDVTATPEAANRFRSEIKLARRVSHPNVCLIHDYGQDGGLNYISMALLEGRDIKEILADHPRGLPPDEAFDVAIQVAEGLEAIHEAGIIHRDLKAPNIMRGADGLVQLMDFGIAKETDPMANERLTATGMVLGTPEYMSPEQCGGGELTFSSDVYALGILVFELFTGDVPFVGDSPVATLMLHIQEPLSLEGPRAARLPKALHPVITRALEKDPEDRYQTAGAFAEAVRAARDEQASQPATDAADEAVSDAPPRPTDPTAALPGFESARAGGRENRSETRLATPINVILRRLDASGAVAQEERTVVDNISRRGARVMTSMTAVAIGDAVELEEVGGDFRARASVRNAYTGGDRIPRLGLLFESSTAPDRLVQTDDARAREVTQSRKLPSPAAATAGPVASTPGDAGSPARRPAPARSPTSAAPRPDQPTGRERRVSTRIESPLEVSLQFLDASGAMLSRERTMAENVSRGGARVLSSNSSAREGDTLVFKELATGFETRAEIRHAYEGPDRIRRLNLQFLDKQAPDHLAMRPEVRAATMSFQTVAKEVPSQAQPVAAAAPEPAVSREEVLELHGMLGKGTHFGVLGISRQSGADEVKKAYLTLARRYHPDAALAASMTELRRQISEIFVRLGEAYQELSDPKRRGEYESRLGPYRRAPTQPAVSSSGVQNASSEEAAPVAPRGPGPEETKQMHREQAERALGEARSLLKAGKHGEAIPVLERGLYYAADIPALKKAVKLHLALASLRDPKLRRRAESLLKEILAEAPENVEARFELAKLYRANKLAARAQREFKRVLEQDPTHEGAAAALAPPPEDDKPGLTKRFRLFKG